MSVPNISSLVSSRRSMLNVEPNEGSSEEDTVTSKQKPGFSLASLSTLAHPGNLKKMASSSIF